MTYTAQWMSGDILLFFLGLQGALGRVSQPVIFSTIRKKLSGPKGRPVRLFARSTGIDRYMDIINYFLKLLFFF